MTEREMFEEWFISEYYGYLSVDIAKEIGLSMTEKGDRYSSLQANRMWEAWQARAKIEETKSRGNNV